MSKFNSKLSLILIAQLLLIAGIFFFQQQTRDSLKIEPLLNFDDSQADKIQISDDQSTLTLQSIGGVWQLPETSNLPVDSNKLVLLFNNLKQLKTSWPVATNQSSHDRFEVAEDKFQRHLQVYSGEKVVADLYIGTSPGFRKVHLRKAEDDNVYAGKLNANDFPIAANEWLNKSLLSLTEFDRINGTDFQLVKLADNWAFDDAETSDEQLPVKLNAEKAKQLAIAFNFLNVQELVSAAASTPPIKLEVSLADKNWTYQFYQNEDKYSVSRNDIPAEFVITQQTYDDIAKKVKQDFVLLEPASEEINEEAVEAQVENDDAEVAPTLDNQQ